MDAGSRGIRCRTGRDALLQHQLVDVAPPGRGKAFSLEQSDVDGAHEAPHVFGTAPARVTALGSLAPHRWFSLLPRPHLLMERQKPQTETAGASNFLQCASIAPRVAGPKEAIIFPAQEHHEGEQVAPRPALPSMEFAHYR